MRQVRRNGQDPVFDRPVFGDEHGQRAAGIEADEFDLAQAAVVLGGDDDARAAREAGQQARRLSKQVFETRVGRLAGDLGFDPRPLLRRQFADLKQRVDEETQAGLGRQAAGAGVRGIDEAQFLQILHDVADRGRRQRH